LLVHFSIPMQIFNSIFVNGLIMLVTLFICFYNEHVFTNPINLGFKYLKNNVLLLIIFH